METEASTENQDASPTEGTKMDTNESETPEGDGKSANAAQSNQPKQILKAVELQIESKTTSFAQNQLQELVEREVDRNFPFEFNPFLIVFFTISEFVHFRPVSDQLTIKNVIVSIPRTPSRSLSSTFAVASTTLTILNPTLNPMYAMNWSNWPTAPKTGSTTRARTAKRMNTSKNCKSCR